MVPIANSFQKKYEITILRFKNKYKPNKTTNWKWFYTSRNNNVSAQKNTEINELHWRYQWPSAFEFLAVGRIQLVTHINYRGTVLYSLRKNKNYKLCWKKRCRWNDMTRYCIKKLKVLFINYWTTRITSIVYKYKRQVMCSVIYETTCIMYLRKSRE
jgi:hypothetical protein